MNFSTRGEYWLRSAVSLARNYPQKKTIKEELKNRINDEGEIVISEQSARSQHTNRKVVTKRFYDLINKALIPEKERRETKPTEGSKNRRINEKKQRSKIKKHRGKVEME